MLNFFNIKIKGYLYVSDGSHDNQFANVKATDIIKNISKKPPYYVVNHELSSIILTQWPGKLFYVETLSNYKRLNSNLRKDAGYTRANGLKILREIQLHEIFGKNGKQLKEIVDKCQIIDMDEAQLLSSSLTDKSLELYSNAWIKWNKTQNIETNNSESYVGTIGVISSGLRLSKYSPVGNVLSTISNLLDKRINEIDKDEGILIDEEGEFILSDLWQRTQQALFNAAMAYENEGLLSSDEKITLLIAWNKISEKNSN